MAENPVQGAKSRVLQEIAKVAPGAQTLRVQAASCARREDRRERLDRLRRRPRDVDPDLITIEDGASIGIRATIIAHFRESTGVRIERDAFIGPGVIVLPERRRRARAPSSPPAAW